MTGRNSAVSSASPPKPPSKSSRNAPHPTTRKRPRETLGPFGRESRHFSSLVGVVVIARKLTYGNSVAIVVEAGLAGGGELHGAASGPPRRPSRVLQLAWVLSGQSHMEVGKQIAAPPEISG